jgi:hypothetical protein
MPDRTLATTRYLSVTHSEVWLFDVGKLDDPATVTHRRVLPAPAPPQQPSSSP